MLALLRTRETNKTGLAAWHWQPGSSGDSHELPQGKKNRPSHAWHLHAFANFAAPDVEAVDLGPNARPPDGTLGSCLCIHQAFCMEYGVRSLEYLLSSIQKFAREPPSRSLGLSGRTLWRHVKGSQPSVVVTCEPTGLGL